MKRYLLIAVLLGGCSSVETLRPDMAARSAPSRLDEIAYINSLRDAFEFEGTSESGCYDGAELRYFRPTLEQGYPDHTAAQEAGPVRKCVRYKTLQPNQEKVAVTRYLEAGFGLTDLYCQRYFVIAAESAQQRRFQRNAGSTVDALINAVLGVAKAGETALAVANAGFEAFDSTYQNIENAFMVAPELENVRKLVHAAQQDFRTRAFQQMPGSYEGARSVIERYAGLCSYTGMKQLVNDSVTSQNRSLDAQADAAQGAKPSTDKPQSPGGPKPKPTPAAAPSPPSADRKTDATVAVPVAPPK